MEHLARLGTIASDSSPLYVATGVIFDARGPVRVGQVIVLAFAANAIVVSYRFVLFLITLYTS